MSYDLCTLGVIQYEFQTRKLALLGITLTCNERPEGELIGDNICYFFTIKL